jgi:hypothetical protein
MRSALWSGFLLLALLPGCLTRTVWQRTHRVETQWVAATRLAVRAEADGSGASAIVMEWPKPADWQRWAGTVEPSAAGAIGLPVDLVAVEVMPRQWPATAVALLQQAWPRPAAAGMDAFAEVTIDQDADVEFTLQVFCEDAASLAEVRAMPGVVMEQFCYTCGATRPCLRDRARLGLAVEAKSGRRVHAGGLRGLAALRSSHAVRKAVVVGGEPEARIVDGVEILPWRMFVDRLWAGDLVV